MVKKKYPKRIQIVHSTNIAITHVLYNGNHQVLSLSPANLSSKFPILTFTVCSVSMPTATVR